MAPLAATDLDVFPLCLGGNVFGWTADEAASFAVLDAYADAGGNFLDTANSYSAWVDGHSGGAFDRLVREGKVRHVALSNYTPERLRAVREVCEREAFAQPVALQPEYNLVARGCEQRQRPVAEEAGWACVPYYGLAKGFLAGKYRPGGPEVDSRRVAGAKAYLDDPRGPRVLEALDAVAGEHGVPVAAVSLAWLVAQPTVAAAIASARTPEQLAELLPMAELTLTAEDLRRLDEASA